MAPIDFNAPYKQQRDDFRKHLIENGVIIKNACGASGIHIYMVDYVNQRITLETKLNPETTVEKYQWNIGDPWVASSVVVLTGREVISDQVIGDDLFPNGIPWRPRAKSAMCLPVISQDSACLGILELYREENDDPFTVDDLSIANVILGWMCAHLTKSSLNEETLQSKDELLRIHNEAFHEIMASFAGEIAGDDLICRVLGKIKRRMHADYIRFCELAPDYESDAPIMCNLYDDGVNIFGERLLAKKNVKYRFTEEFGPLWKAVEEVKSINLTFPCSDPDFPKIGNFYKGTGTKSLLAYPLPPEGAIRGALAVVNKVNGPRFTISDEIACEIWMKSLGLLCYFNSKKSSFEKLAFKRKLLEKLLVAKLMPIESEKEYFINSYKTLRIPMNFLSFKWCPIQDRKNMVELCVYMMKDMLEPQLATNDPLLFGITCIVRNTYRDLPYHNFEHAVGVMHCAYIILKRNRDLFDQIEVTSIMFAALCHDVNHFGLTNSFLVTTNHTLAKLYEKSPLEHHHYFLCYLILRNHNIFQHLDSNEYRKLLNNIKNNILATDLAVFLERRRSILKLKKNKTFNIINERDKSLMKSILMTACDLSSTCKPFPRARMYTEAIIKEFYEQGDKEKMLGLIPASIMNRDLSARLPEEQVNFYVSLALPCYSLLVQIIPNTEPLYYGCLNAYLQWLLEVEKKNQPVWKVEDSYLSAE